MIEGQSLRATIRSLSAERRGQVVLLAAFAIAVALVPLILAYLQLGYHADTDRTLVTEPETRAEGVLERAIQNLSGEYGQGTEWEKRGETVRSVRNGLDPTIRTLETARLSDGIVYEITYNESRAATLAETACPGGPNRQYGDCEAVDGIVVQERAGETHLLVVALDIRVTLPEGSKTLRSDYHVPPDSSGQLSHMWENISKPSV